MDWNLCLQGNDAEGKMRKGNLQTQQTPKPEAQEPEATPPLLLHSASVNIIIIFTPVQIKMIKYNHYIHLCSDENYIIDSNEYP